MVTTLKILRKHSQKLRKSVRRRRLTEPQLEDGSTNVQQPMHIRSRFEEGQEHNGVQCDMDGTVKADDEAIEIEIYANLLWKELQ
jgi:hypothetical protein